MFNSPMYFQKNNDSNKHELYKLSSCYTDIFDFHRTDTKVYTFCF